MRIVSSISVGLKTVMLLYVAHLFWLSCIPVDAKDDKGSMIAYASMADTIDAKLLRLNQTAGLVFLEEEPFSGVSVTFYPNGKKAKEIAYLKGKKQGFHRIWFPDGKLSFECQYKMGRKEGESRSWWKNGQLRSFSNFKNGVADGIQWQWYKSGAKFKKMNLVNGREEGLQQSWRENGKLYNNYEAKNGRIFGLKRANLCYQLDDEKVVYKK